MKAFIDTASFVFQWLMITLICAVLATSFIYLGYSLQAASANYAQGQRMDTLKALYSSVDWAAVVESANHKRLKAERKLEMVCKKNKKACI